MFFQHFHLGSCNNPISNNLLSMPLPSSEGTNNGLLPFFLPFPPADIEIMLLVVKQLRQFTNPRT